jgi:transposase-like protein
MHRAIASDGACDPDATCARAAANVLALLFERLHEEFKRRIKTQTVLPSADTAAMLFWALLASGQTNMRKVDGWQTLATKPIDQQFDLAA